jgi:thiamine-phosphate pyrophosphorylase
MHFQFTPGAQRALARASDRSLGNDSAELSAQALLLGLLAEPECRAALILARHGIDADAVRRQWPDLTCSVGQPNHADASPQKLSNEVDASLRVACRFLADFAQPCVLATEHVLLGLAATEHEVALWLRRQGLDPKELESEIHELYGYESGPLPLKSGGGEGLPPPIVPQGEPVKALRVIDAAANRAREGLRVVEDYARFVLDDRHLTDHCKRLRHDLATLLGRIPAEHLLAARETQADVGTALSTPTERHRSDLPGVLTANLARLQEALRSLEEYGKLLDPEFSAGLEQLRYRSYTLHRAIEITRRSCQRLARACLYVLLDGRPSPEEFERLARSLVESGVHAIQLRDKQLDDRRLLERAKLLSAITRENNVLFIMNDRPDLAVLAAADGVHVGQEELAVKDARTIVGPEALVGVSTHSIEQARQAVLDGADYIGVGPVFPSTTKQFEHYPGLDLLRAVAAEIRLPAFAVGGIDRENLGDVLETGVSRIAVSGAVLSAPDPGLAIRQLAERLQTGRRP